MLRRAIPEGDQHAAEPSEWVDTDTPKFRRIDVEDVTFGIELNSNFRKGEDETARDKGKLPVCSWG